jgi:hypothetical protein
MQMPLAKLLLLALKSAFAIGNKTKLQKPYA